MDPATPPDDPVNHPRHYRSHPSEVGKQPERWALYPNDERYEVGSHGHVRRLGKEIRRPSTNGKSKYQIIVFSVPGRKHVGRYIHRMVLETFVGPCPENMEASHLDGDPTNNNLENLIYETRKENHARKYHHGTDYRGSRNPASKLTRDQVEEIRSSTDSSRSLADRYGVSRATIGRAKRHESWK